MAIDSFLKLGTLKGESVVKGFEDQMQILAWGWGMTQTGTTHSASGGGAGKVDVHDLQITKNIDAASPGCRTLMLIPICGNRGSPSKRV